MRPQKNYISLSNYNPLEKGSQGGDQVRCEAVKTGKVNMEGVG